MRPQRVVVSLDQDCRHTGCIQEAELTVAYREIWGRIYLVISENCNIGTERNI
jgi:hypothetical protein